MCFFAPYEIAGLFSSRHRLFLVDLTAARDLSRLYHQGPCHSDRFLKEAGNAWKVAVFY
jgi:hypothetical protein